MTRTSITPAQCRAARALIELSQAGLAGIAVVPVPVITDYEAGAGTPRPADLEAIQRQLERAGVEFTNGSQPGVRLKSHRAGTIPANQAQRQQ
jgi:predicted transcriptional regulator